MRSATHGDAGARARDNGATEAALRKIRLMIVDDHPAVRWGLVQLLEEQPDFAVAAVCVNADGAAGRAEAESIDAAVVDYSLGGRNGLWLCRRLKRLRRPPRVIVFSAFADEHLAACCAVAGADAVLNKGALGSELCHAIRAVMRGRRMLPRISPGLAGMLRGRLADDEQLLFGMLLAGMAREEVARTLGIPMHELLSREDTLLDEVEPLPGEIAAIERGRRPLDLERVVPRAPFHSTSGA